MFLGNHGPGRRGSRAAIWRPQITKDFGASKAASAFNDAGTKVFARAGIRHRFCETETRIEPRPNQDTPLMDGRRALLERVWSSLLSQLSESPRARLLKAW